MIWLRATLMLIALAVPARAEIAIQEVTSPGGIKAWLVEEPGIPFVAIEIAFRGGQSLDPADKRGAVNLMTALIEEGAGDLDAQGFAAARDALAAELSFGSSTDEVSVSARMLTENRDAAVDLLRSALLSPRFDADAIERVRGQVLANIRGDAQDPSSIAGRILDERAFPGHPYGTQGDGTAESVAALTRDDLLAAHRATLAKDRMYVAAAGDITPEALGLLLDRLLGDLPETGTPLPGRATLALTPGVTVEDFPGPQSTILFASAGIKRDDPDFFAASILNEILGGGRFSARLMTEVREKRGLTYGIGTGLIGLDQAELFMGQMSASNENVAEAIQVVRDEWVRLSRDGVTDQELADTKTFLTGAYPLRFDGNGRIASILVGMQMIGLAADYPATRNDKVNAVTMDDMRRVIDRLIRPDDLRFIVVGSPEGVTPVN